MHTLRLKINENVYEKVLKFLSKFNEDEVKVLSEQNDFISTKKYLQKELDNIISEKAVFYSVKDVDEKLEKIIKKHEDNL